jgi:hypothetical protein
MADLKTYPNRGAFQGTGTPVTDHLGRHTDEDVVQVVDSSRGALRIQEPLTLKAAVAVVLAVWLAAVILLGARDAFVSSVGMPPIAIGIAAGTPLIVFFVAFWLSAAFRRFVTSADIRLVAAIEAWRWAGFGFISLYVYGVLPGRFAWPAGLGDMAIGFTAPWIVLALVRRPSFAGSRLFVIWNLLGILDLAAAVSNAALIQSQATGAAGEATVAPMALLPLLLIPAYLVPLFIMLHVTALIQARRVALSERRQEARSQA